MKTFRPNILTAAIFALFLSLNGTISAQTLPRPAKPTPTPFVKTSVSPTPTPQTSPKGSPTPTPTTALPSVYSNLADVQMRVRAVLSRPEYARARVGIKFIALDSGKILFEQDAEKYFMPASNMKSFTVAAALDRLSPEYRFATSVYAPSRPDANGTLRGDVIIYGRGDPSISTAFNDKDYFRGIDALAQKIADAGVKRIEGNLIGDDSFFTSESIPDTWEIGDLQWSYGAEVSALSVNDNAIDVSVNSGAKIGDLASVTFAPYLPSVRVINRVLTVGANEKAQISVTREVGANIIEVGGKIPLGSKTVTNYIAVVRPAQIFVELLRQRLMQKSILVTGQNRAVSAKDRNFTPLLTNNLIELARLDSPRFAEIAAKTMKPSQNLYTEMILRTLGETVGDKTRLEWNSKDRGIDVIAQFLQKAGIAPDSVLMSDASGLSRHDLITPNAAVSLYAFMDKHQYAQAWRDSLTIAGVDGTLENRFRGTAGANNVRGKTGTIGQVATLSGYLTTAGGERVAFSVLVNNSPGSSRIPRNLIDEIVLLFVNFNGKLN